VTDDAGHRASAVRTVQVQDTLAPAITLHGPSTSTLECGLETFTDPGASAMDVCAGDVSGRIAVSGTVNPGVEGRYDLRYTAMDPSGLTASATRQVTVADTRSPSIVCPGPRVYEASGPEGALVTPALATASDACSTPSVSGPPAGLYRPGSTPVTYTATDAAGHAVSCTTSIHVTSRDTTHTPPKLFMCDMPRHTREPLLKACGFVTSHGGAPLSFVYFTVDGGQPIPVVPEASGGMVVDWMSLPEGTHTIELTAIDAVGAVSRATRTVNVDRTAPVIRIVSPVPGEAQPSSVVAITSEVTDASPSTVTTQWVQNSRVGAGTNSVTHTVDLVNWGDNWVLVRAQDSAGNVSEVFTTVTVSP
jgi:hypothetical protein